MANGYETDSGSASKARLRNRTLSTPSKVVSKAEKKQMKKAPGKEQGDKTDDEGYQSTHSSKSPKRKGSKFFRKFSKSSSSTDHDDDKEVPPPVPAFPPSYSASISAVNAPAPAPSTPTPPVHLPIAARFATTLSFDSNNNSSNSSFTMPARSPALSSSVTSPISNFSYDTTASYFPTTPRQVAKSSPTSPARTKSPPLPPPSSSSSFFQKNTPAPAQASSSSRPSSSRSSKSSTKEKNRSSGASDEQTSAILKKRTSGASSSESQTQAGSAGTLILCISMALADWSEGFRITSPFKENSKKDKTPARPTISYPLTRPKSPAQTHLSPDTLLGRPVQPRITTGTTSRSLTPNNNSQHDTPLPSPNRLPSSRAASPNDRRGVSPAFPQKTEASSGNSMDLETRVRVPRYRDLYALDLPPQQNAAGSKDWLDMSRSSEDSSTSSHGGHGLAYRRDQAELSSDDDRSIYPDNRQTMYDDSEAFNNGGNDRETMYTLSNGSRPESLAFLDANDSSAVRTRFVQGVSEMMYDGSGRETLVPPVPAIPRELLSVPANSASPRRRAWN